MTSRIDDFGGPNANNHYAVGWAHAMDTPYQWTKQVASHWGGTRNGMIVHWPSGIDAKGELRSQFTHVIDVAPTVLEAAHLPAPDVRPRHPAGPARGGQHAVLLRRRRTPPSGTRRSTSRSSSTAASTTRAGPRSPGTRPRGVPQHGTAGARRRRLGAVHPRRLDPGPQRGRRAARTAAGPAAAVPASRPASTTCSRWTTAATSGSTPTSPAGRSSSRATPRCCSAGWAGCRRTA